MTVCALSATIDGNHENWWEGEGDWYAKFYVCDSNKANCGGAICNTGVTGARSNSGHTVTWDYCCDVGTVVNGQYVKIEVHDEDVGGDDLGGVTWRQLRPGCCYGAPQTDEWSADELGGHTWQGSSLTYSIDVSSVGWTDETSLLHAMLG